MGLNLRHIGILTATHLRHALGSGRGLRYLVLFGLLGAIIAYVVVSPILGLIETVSAEELALFNQRLAPVVDWWIDAAGPSDPRVVFLMDERPAVLSAVFVVLTGFMPWVACVAPGNHLAREITHRELRFIALRSKRHDILMSRFLGSVGLLSTASLLLLMTLAIYVGISVHSVPISEALWWSVEGWFALTLVAMPYIGLGILVSVAVPVPAATRVLTVVIAGTVPIALHRLAAEFDVRGLVKLDPWAWKYHVLAPPPGQELPSILVIVGFTVIPLTIAASVFKRRGL